MVTDVTETQMINLIVIIPRVLDPIPSYGSSDSSNIIGEHRGTERIYFEVDTRACAARQDKYVIENLFCVDVHRFRNCTTRVPPLSHAPTGTENKFLAPVSRFVCITHANSRDMSLYILSSSNSLNAIVTTRNVENDPLSRFYYE